MMNGTTALTHEALWNAIYLLNDAVVGIFGMILSAAFCDLDWTRKRLLRYWGCMAVILLVQAAVYCVADVALLRAAAAKAGVSDITQKKDALRFTLAVFRPEALVQVCGLTKYKFRLTLSAGETPMLTLKLKPGADVLETALELVEDLKLATQALEKA